jgi:hypothetical protein
VLARAVVAPMGLGLVKGVKGSARWWDLGLAGLCWSWADL